MTAIPGAPAFIHRIEHVDTDACGVVHFSRYASLMETTVLELLDSCGAGLSALREEQLQLAVVELRISYARPAGYQDVVVGMPALEEVKGARFRAAASLARLADDGQRALLASGHLEFAVTDMSSGRAVPLPPLMRKRLKGIIADA